MKAWVRVWAWAWVRVWVVVLLPATPCAALSIQPHLPQSQLPQPHLPQPPQLEEPVMSQMLEAIYRVSRALETQERHTSLYERVALLETSLAEKTARATLLQAEVTQLRAKIPELEAEIETIPEMRKELAEFEAKIEKLVHDYEAKLSTLASEVIRLKKYGARRKELLTLSDGSNVLLRPALSCPEVGQGMVAERVGEQCLYFSFGATATKNWTTAHHHCQTLRGQMAAPPDLHPLKFFLRQAFTRGPSLWLGSSYNLSDDEDGGEAEDQDLSGLVGKVPDSNPEATSIHPLPQNPSDVIQADDAIGFPEGGVEGPPNPFALHLKEGPIEEGEEEEVEELVLGPAGSLRGVLDQVPMFRDDLLGRYGSLSLSDEPAESAQRPDEETERSAGNSVVDIVLLAGSEGHQNAKTRVSFNQTGTGGQAAGNGVLQEGVVSLGGGSVDEVAGSTHGAGKTKETGKARMKCMLLQQSGSLEYEVVGRPCSEMHNFVCNIKVTIDSLLPE